MVQKIITFKLLLLKVFVTLPESQDVLCGTVKNRVP